jgi:hypothetical protein
VITSLRTGRSRWHTTRDHGGRGKRPP